MSTGLASPPRKKRPILGRPELTKQQFAERLKELRLRAKLNQSQLAERVGVSQGRISEWESGEVQPFITTAIEIAQALGVSCDELLPLYMAEPRDPEQPTKRIRKSD